MLPAVLVSWSRARINTVAGATKCFGAAANGIGDWLIVVRRYVRM